LVYIELAQNNIGPAGYFKDVKRYDTYVEKAVFLPPLNNEINGSVNQTYIKNLQALEAIMLVMFDADTMVDPKQSEWWGYYD